jgi:hypothetical protein
VLAHVEGGRLAASCHDPAYVAWAEARLGPIAERSLGEDARILASVCTTHDALARVQAVAWLFNGEDDASAVAMRDLATLADKDVVDPMALRAARAAGPAAEVLRAAAELELPRIAALAPPEVDRVAVSRELAIVARVAPRLSSCRIALARALGLRGRVLGSSIVVGAPGAVPGGGCPDAAHAAWQAAHEATVLEVGPLAFEDAERSAIDLLHRRARDAGLDAAHARWIARFDLHGVGGSPGGAWGGAPGGAPPPPP